MKILSIGTNKEEALQLVSPSPDGRTYENGFHRGMVTGLVAGFIADLIVLGVVISKHALTRKSARNPYLFGKFSQPVR